MGLDRSVPSLAVWKYAVEVADEFTVEMPESARIIHVGMQGDLAQMWAIVDANAPRRVRTFYLRGTGHPVEPEMVYLGSFMTDSGRFVWHLFAASNGAHCA